jgi:uncharacterized protein (TIGR02611 family)
MADLHPLPTLREPFDMNRREKLKAWFAALPTPLRKVLVLVFGGTVLIIGVVMIFLPGPAMLIIPFGLTILSIEFIWARVLLKRAKAMAHTAAIKTGLVKPGNPPHPCRDQEES